MHVTSPPINGKPRLVSSQPAPTSFERARVEAERRQTILMAQAKLDGQRLAAHRAQAHATGYARGLQHAQWQMWWGGTAFGCLIGSVVVFASLRLGIWLG